MPTKRRQPDPHPNRVVELTRVQPFEAQVIVARLRASGIEAALGADSPYESLSYAYGVPVLVSEEDAQRAAALLEESGEEE